MAWQKGHVYGNHDRAAAGRKGKANSPWRHDVVRSPNSRKLREKWASEKREVADRVVGRHTRGTTMRPDQMPRQPFDAQDEPTALAMTNAELADAIRYAFDTCSQTYTGGYQTRDSEAGKVMLAHLKELTATQAKRAALFIVPPNA